jgi:hypothetical protein
MWVDACFFAGSNCFEDRLEEVGARDEVTVDEGCAPCRACNLMDFLDNMQEHLNIQFCNARFPHDIGIVLDFDFTGFLLFSASLSPSAMVNGSCVLGQKQKSAAELAAAVH